MDECPVCLEETHEDEATRLLPCKHAVCAACTLRLHAACVDRCPLCRKEIAGIEVLETASDDDSDVLEFCVGNGTHAGITLANAAATSEGGSAVRVVALAERDAAFAAHLRVGDLITHVNGIPATQHRMAVNIIDASTRHALPVRVRRAPPTRRKPWSAMECLTGCFRRHPPARRNRVSDWERMFRERDDWIHGHAAP